MQRRRILHVLSQRPALTGSGVTLDALAHQAALSQSAGDGRWWEQRAVVGTPADEPEPAVDGLPPEAVDPLVFGCQPLPFPVPGMSDVMPYPSSRFGDLDEGELAAYRTAWSDHLRGVVERFRPDLVHSHHLWLVSSLLKDAIQVAGLDVPVVTQCHATGFRQMELCPHLAEEVIGGCRRNDRFLVLHEGHRDELCHRLKVPAERVVVVGAGYREELFHRRGAPPAEERSEDRETLLYVGKYSVAKGVPWLLDAFARLRTTRPGLRLHVAGGGDGAEAAAIRERMDSMAPWVVQHGQLRQPELARLMRRSEVFVLPSFFEGLPLVLVEAFACGCRLVATRLPSIETGLAPHLAPPATWHGGPVLDLVDPPRLDGPDRPAAGEGAGFTERLAQALGRAVDAPVLPDPSESFPEALEAFTWRAVFRRVERVWDELVGR